MNSLAIPESVQLKVLETRALNPLIRVLRLGRPDGAALPAWSPGAHIQVQVRLPDESADWRHYSLIDLQGMTARSGFTPGDYTIAVRLEENGRGGSRFMHERLRAGDPILARSPKNDFPLRLDGGGVTTLLAGGIGITPLASMAAYCRAQGHAVRLHYAGRSRALMAFVDELRSLLGDDLRIHSDEESAGGVFDVGALLDSMGTDGRLFVCGPKPMLDAVLAASQARGWSQGVLGRVHFELFSEPVAEAGDRPFEVTLAQSGKTFTVAANQTLLDGLIKHGCDPLFDCKRGECGVCAAPVIEGEIDHRDYVLTASEKEAGNVIQTCVSRAKGARLVLDM